MWRCQAFIGVWRGNRNRVTGKVKSQQELGVGNTEELRPFLRGKLWPPGAKLSPWSEFCPLGVKLSPGVKFSVRPSILLNRRECSPLGVIEGVNVHPSGKIPPLGTKFTPRAKVHLWARGEVKNVPQVSNLRLIFSMTELSGIRKFKKTRSTGWAWARKMSSKSGRI
jgi:hypothetical protein